jgi:hypothetical protein
VHPGVYLDTIVTTSSPAPLHSSLQCAVASFSTFFFCAYYDYESSFLPCLSTTISLVFAGWSSALLGIYDGLLLLVLGLPMGLRMGMTRQLPAPYDNSLTS